MPSTLHQHNNTLETQIIQLFIISVSFMFYV